MPREIDRAPNEVKSASAAQAESPATQTPGLPTPAEAVSTPSAVTESPASASTSTVESTGNTPNISGSMPPAVPESPESPVAVRTQDTVALPASVKPGVRIVKPGATGSRVYDSLRQACSDAASNDVIELHFDGRLEEKPFRVKNKQLIIRAGETFNPTIAFRPREPLTSEPQAMLTVVGGQLTLANVALELDVPSRLDPPSWALFQTQRANSLRLMSCWLTIRNATPQRTSHHQFVAFFDIKAPPDTGAMAMEHGAMAEHSVNIEMQNCVARGEATLLRCEELQPVRLSWHNGLLATSERLLLAHGGEMANRVSGQISVELRHVTAHARGGLCLITNAEGSRPLLRTQLHCADSILLATADVPLLEQAGVNSVEEFEGHVQWEGNRYFYSGFGTFWKISSFAPALPAQDPVQRSFDEWQRHWRESVDKQETWSRVVWKRLPDASRPMHTHTPADYALDETAPRIRLVMAPPTAPTPACTPKTCHPFRSVRR